MASNYEQLVKALRCCISNNPPETCVGCTYSKCNNECAVRRMILDAAAAIETLLKENKELIEDHPEMVEADGHWEWRKPNGEVLMPKQGEWIIHGEPPMLVIECSVCGQKYFNHVMQEKAKYCSMCGAKMEETEDEVHSDI